MTDTNESPFWARRESRDDAVVLHAGGELDAFTVDQFAEQLQAAEDVVAPPAPVLLDLSDITYLSSAGVAALVISAERCADAGRRLCVVADQPAVLRPITLTGADNVVAVAPTLDAALKAG